MLTFRKPRLSFLSAAVLATFPGILFRPYHRLQDENNGGGGGGGGSTIPAELMPEVQKLIDTAVSGLKNKNSELIGSLKTVKQNLEKFEGIDPDAVRTILSKFSSDEEAALIASGKIDEVLAKRTERLSADWQKKLEKEVAERDKVTNVNKKLAAKATAQAITTAAAKAGALPEALEDITLRAQGLWRVNDDGDVIAMNGDEPIFGKDGKTPLTPMEWAESLRETAPHLWPKAQGSGAPGSGAGNGKAGAIDPSLPPAQRMTMARQQAGITN